MKNIKKSFLLVVLLLLVIFFGTYFLFRKNLLFTNLVSTQITTNGEIVEFEGKLTKFDDNCQVDGVCKASVNGYTIITNPGDMQVSALGQSNIWNEDVGKKVKVKAKRINDTNFTLVGDSTLYVKLAE